MATKKFADVKTSDFEDLNEKYELDQDSMVKIAELVDKTIWIHQFVRFRWTEKKTGDERDSIKVIFKFDEKDPEYFCFMHDSETLKRQLEGMEIDEGDVIEATVRFSKSKASNRSYYYFE